MGRPPSGSQLAADVDHKACHPVPEVSSVLLGLGSLGVHGADV